MNEIKLKRGGRDVTFKKLPTHFAVRLKQGKASNEGLLAASCGPTKAAVKHIESVPSEKMEVFSVVKTGLEQTVDGLRAAPGSDVVTHMYAVDDTPGGAVIPTGRMMIQFKPDVPKDQREEILAKFGLEVLTELDYVPHGYTVRVTEASKENPLKMAAKLTRNKAVQAAEPDLSFQISLKQHVPTDPLYPQQWHLNNPGGVGLLAGADVKAQEAWEQTRGSRDIAVCVMDDGFDLGHPEFDVPGKIVAPRDFGQNDFDPNPVFADDNHGTACAGVAIAEENGVGVVGLAPGCSFMPIRTSGWLSDENLEALFQYTIDNNADVISCSWSAAAWNFPLSTRVHGIIHKAATQGRSNGKGCVILFAAGNENRPLDGIADNGEVSVQGFALHPDVIAVGASNSFDMRSDYSNHGPELTLCAPSSGSPGRRIVTTDRRGANGYSSSDYTDDFGGTSSSTPLAAGLAALILSVNPDLTSAEVRQIMMETADKIDEANGQYVDGHSTRYGHGRINAARAVARAVGNDGQGPPKTLFMEHRVNIPIQDWADVENVIPCALDTEIGQIEVSLEIRHTWRGDLRVVLQAPDGQQIVLHDRSGGGQDDIVETFRSTNDPDPGLLAPLIGSPAQGQWRLTVADRAQGDQGTLVKWGLGITY